LNYENRPKRQPPTKAEIQANVQAWEERNKAVMEKMKQEVIERRIKMDEQKIATQPKQVD
jgi:hypothetical protein